MAQFSWKEKNRKALAIVDELDGRHGLDHVLQDYWESLDTGEAMEIILDGIPNGDTRLISACNDWINNHPLDSDTALIRELEEERKYQRQLFYQDRVG